MHLCNEPSTIVDNRCHFLWRKPNQSVTSRCSVPAPASTARNCSCGYATLRAANRKCRSK